MRIKKINNLLLFINFLGLFWLPQEDVIGKNCKITEPIYGTQFDFNSLHSLGHKIKGEGNDLLKFNVCGKLSDKCNDSDASAILHLNGLQICFGKTTGFLILKSGKSWFCFVFYLTFESDETKAHEPIYTDGRLYFNLTGGVCNKSQKYRLIVVLVCDYSSHVQEPLHLMPYVSQSMDWTLFSTDIMTWFFLLSLSFLLLFFSLLRFNSRTTHVNLLLCGVYQMHVTRYQRHWIQTLALLKT